MKSENTTTAYEQLDASQLRLESAGLALAIKGGRAILIQRDTFTAWLTGSTVWEPSDMRAYVDANERERGIMRGLKQLRPAQERDSE